MEQVLLRIIIEQRGMYLSAGAGGSIKDITVEQSSFAHNESRWNVSSCMLVTGSSMEGISV